MRDIEIETYKGQTIFYDTDADKFTCEISVEDKFTKTKRQSLKDVRSEIDRFIKLNLEFKPFKVFSSQEYGKIEAYSIVGIRTDGRFMFEKSGNYTSFETAAQLMRDYSAYDADIEIEANEAKRIFEIAEQKYRKKKDELRTKMKPLDLSKYEALTNKA